MAPKPRNKAGMDAAAVAALVAAQDEEDTAPVVVAAPQDPPAPIAPPPPFEPPAAPAFDPGAVDGRTLRRTGREPFATRIKPETHAALRRIAYNRRITIAEALEMAVAAFERG